MEPEHAYHRNPEKNTDDDPRNDNTAVYAAVLSMGTSLRDLDLLTVGMVNDMAIERENDDYKWPIKATQADINKFFG